MLALTPERYGEMATFVMLAIKAALSLDSGLRPPEPEPETDEDLASLYFQYGGQPDPTSLEERALHFGLGCPPKMDYPAAAELWRSGRATIKRSRAGHNVVVVSGRSVDGRTLPAFQLYTRAQLMRDFAAWCAMPGHRRQMSSYLFEGE